MLYLMRKVYLVLTLLFSVLGSLNVNAQCTPVATWSQNFDGVTAPAMPACFVRQGTGGIAAVYSFAAAPSTPNVLYIASSTAIGRGVVKLPPVSNFGAGTHQLRLKMRMNSNQATAPDVEFGYFPNSNDTTFISLRSYTVTSTSFTEYKWRAPAIAGVQQFGIRVTAYGNGVIFDDMYWEATTSADSCTAVPVRYEEQFTGTSIPQPPYCTALQNAGNGMNWRTGQITGTWSGFSGNVLYYQYHPSQAANAWWYTRGLNLQGGTQYKLSFKYGNDTSSGSENLKVAYGTSPYATSMTNVLGTYSGISDTMPHVPVINFTPATSGVYYIGFNAFSTADQSLLFLDSVVVDAITSCAGPTNIVVNNISATGASVSFTGLTPAPASGYQYYVGSSAPTAAGTPVSGTSFNATGLTPNTNYTVYVRTVCPDGSFSSWTASTVFTTLCSAVAPPYEENFDGAANPAPPTCTSFQNAGNGNSWITTPAPNPARFGMGPTGKMLQYTYHGTSAANAWWFTRGLNLTGGTTYYVKYKYSVRSNEFPENLKVAFGTAPYNTAMTTTIVDHLNITDTLGVMDSVVFTPATSGEYYVGFNAHSDADQWLLFMDSVKIAPVASITCNAPTGVTASDITTNSAMINLATGAGPYQYYISTTNSAPTGAGVDTAWAPIALTQLLPATTYYFWIRSNCNGTFSTWTPVLTFTTLGATCAQPTNVVVNNVSQTTATVTFTPATPAPSGYEYVVSTSATEPTGTGNAVSGSPINLTSLMANTTYYVFIRSVCTGSVNSVWTTAVSFTTLANATCAQPTNVVVNNITQTTATVTFTPATPAPSGYEYVVSTSAAEPTAAGTTATGSPINLTTLEPGTTYYVFIRSVCTGSVNSAWTPAVSFTTLADQSCNPVVGLDTLNVSSTGTDITFTDPNTGSTGYTYYINTTNTMPATGVDFAAIPANITGLTPNTTYYVWVSVICANGQSNTVGPISFTTDTASSETCDPVNVRYEEDFSTAVPPAVPVCTTVQTIGDGNSWYAGAAPNEAGFTDEGGNVLIYEWNSANAGNTWWFTKGINLTAGTNYYVSYKYGNNSTFYEESMKVAMGTANNATAMTTTLADHPVIDDDMAHVNVVNFTVPTSGVYYFGFQAYSIADQYRLLLDSIVVDVQPSCVGPTELAATATTTTGTTVTFTAPTTAPANGYLYYLGTASGVPAGTVGTPATGSPISVSGLTENTTYYLYIRSVCSATDTSSWTATPLVFTTLQDCQPVNVRYEEDFSSVTPPALPYCTTVEGIGNSNLWQTVAAPGTSGFTAAGGNVLRYAYSTTVDANTWWYTRGINLTAGTSYFVSYKYGNNSTFYEENLKVAMGTANNAAAMTTVLADHAGLNDNTAHVNSVTFTVPTTGVYYFGFQAYSDADNYNLYLDSIVVDVTPSCMAPTTVAATAITGTGGTITFTPPATSPANGYAYVVTTTAGAPTVAGTAATGSPITITGLNNLTTYYVYIRSVCSTTDSSAWSSTTFTTLADCSPVNVRYEEQFSSVTPPALPSCTIVENNSTSSNQWITSTSPNANGFTAAGGNVLRYNYDFNDPADSWWITKGINLTAGSNYFISYKYGNNSTFYSEKMKVAMGTSQNSGAMITLLADHDDITGASATVNTVNFTVPTSGVYYFGFNVYSDANMFYLYLDSVVVDLVPTCITPTGVAVTDVTTTGSTVSFSGPAPAPVGGYQYYVSTSPTAPAQGTVAGTSATSPFTLTGLNPNTTYYVYIRSVCTPGDTSYWSAPASFLTLPVCATLNVRYEQHFDGLTPPAIPVCTVKENLGSGNEWNTAVAPNANGFTAAGGNILRYNYSFSDAANAWWITEGINLTAGSNYYIAYKFGSNSSFYQEFLKVGMGTSQNASAMSTTLIDQVINNSQARDTTLYFTVPTTGVYYFGFNVHSNANQFNLYIDSIIIDLAPTCLPPGAPSVVSFTNNTAVIDWTGTAASYDYYVSTSATPAPTATTTPTGSSDSTGAVITGLSSATQYYIWIRSNCGGGDLSTWILHPITVLTACDPVSTFPWTENFDNMPNIGLGILPVCWKVENGDWRTANQAYTSQNDPYSNPNYLVIPWSAVNETVWTPGFQLQADSSYDFSFWFTGDGSSGWQGDVYANSAQNTQGAVQLGGSFITADTASFGGYTQIFRRFTPTTTGTYYFALKINANFAPWYLGFDDFDVRPSVPCFAPGTGINYDFAYCNLSTSGVPGLTGTTGGYFTASEGVTIDPATGEFNPSLLPYGTYQINYNLPPLQSCPLITFSDTIHVVPPPSASFTYPTSTVCNDAGELVPTFTGQVNGVFSSTEGLAINPANGVISAAGSNGGAYVVTYTIPATNGCAEFTTTANVTINAQSVIPQSVTTSAATVCGNTTVDLSVNGGFLGTGATWTWYRDTCGGTSIGTGATLSNVSVGQTTTFYVRGEGQCNTTECRAVTITYGNSASISITASPDSTASPLSPVVLTAHVSPVGAGVIQWYQNGNILPNQNDSTLTVTSGNLGTYTASVVSGNCSTESNAIAITLGTDPVVPTGTVFISPNPGNGVFSIRTPNDLTTGQNVKSVMVFDSKGARVYYKRFVSPAGIPFNMVIDIRAASSGLYFVKVLDINDTEIASGKYLKSN